ncbi:carph-isopro domain-containing protein [Pseudochelatococcus sp. G4_1912]|uniref:carph-isopro domain-containing protein n=1 Tax=Pseudochelatococcus sp. G4_1912 TaxID=3114288 RepID=UPI0039C6E80B
MQTFSSIIDAFGGYTKFAQAVGIDKLGTVSAWKTRDSIPSSYWQRVVDAASEAGIDGVSLEALAMAAANKRTSNFPLEQSISSEPV